MDDVSSPNAEILTFSVSWGEILSSLANLSDINDLCAPLSNKMLASVCNTPALTQVTAVFSKQTVLTGNLIAGSGGMMVVVTVVGFCASTSFVSILGVSLRDLMVARTIETMFPFFHYV